MIIRDSMLRDAAKLVAWYPLRWTISCSPWRLAYWAGEAVGFADARLARGRVEQIVRNLRASDLGAITPARARAVARRIVARHYVEHMEFYKLGSLTAANLDRHLAFTGLEHLDRALRDGRGAILVHMHFGSKQFPLVGLGLRGYPVHQIGYRDADAEDHSFIHRKVHLRIRNRIEARFRARHIHVGRSMRPVYDALGRNEIVMITGDGIGGIRGAGENYLPVPFLGRTMLFPPGPARIAWTTGAALIPLFCVQEPGWRYRAVFEPPVTQQRGGDRARDVQANTARYAGVFEDYVRRYPDHWMFWEEFQPGYLLQSEAEPVKS